MSANETYSGKDYKPTGYQGGQRSAAAAKLILLDEYESLLRTNDPIRFLNRSLLIAIVVLQIIYVAPTASRQLFLLAVTALASCFWFFHELSMDRRLGRLGELIASTSGELITEMKED